MVNNFILKTSFEGIENLKTYRDNFTNDLQYLYSEKNKILIRDPKIGRYTIFMYEKTHFC